jgi:hypothetical protein
MPIETTKATKKMVHAAFLQMTDYAARFKQKLKFPELYVLGRAEIAIGKPCTYCGEQISEDRVRIVWDEYGRGYRMVSGQFTIENVVGCCKLCAHAKGDLEGHCFRDMVMVLPFAKAMRLRMRMAHGRAKLNHKAVPLYRENLDDEQERCDNLVGPALV